MKTFAVRSQPPTSAEAPAAARPPGAPGRSMPIDDSFSRLERLGHKLEALAPSGGEAAIQRVIYPTDKAKEKKLPFKKVAFTKPYKEMDGAGKAWFHHYHNDKDSHYTVEELKEKIRQHNEEGLEPPQMPKKKRKTYPFVPRKTTAFVGTQVNYSNDRHFRTERRILRRLNKAGKSVGDKNVYTKRYKIGGKGVKLVTSSIPASKFPKNYEKLDLNDLVDTRLGQNVHSEGVTDKIEKQLPLFQKLAPHEHYSASSREQCESCRYDFPPLKPESHKFGTYYSGTTDHIENEELRNKLIVNKGIIGNLKLSSEERKKVAQGRFSAQQGRQHSDDQNPLLNRQRTSLSSEDSEGEHSSDDDDLYVTDDLAWKKNAKGWGKSQKEVHVIPRRSFFTEQEIQKVEERTKQRLNEMKNGNKDEMDDDMGEDDV